MPYTSPILSLPLLSNSELMVTVSLSLVLSNQERERGFSTSRNMFYCTWDFLSSSLCLLHNFQLPFFSLANSRFYFFLHWVTCPWKLNSFCLKLKSVLSDRLMLEALMIFLLDAWSHWSHQLFVAFKYPRLLQDIWPLLCLLSFCLFGSTNMRSIRKRIIPQGLCGHLGPHVGTPAS